MKPVLERYYQQDLYGLLIKTAADSIANSRILSVDNGDVTFRYKDSKRGA